MLDCRASVNSQCEEEESQAKSGMSKSQACKSSTTVSCFLFEPSALGSCVILFKVDVLYISLYDV